MRDDAEMSARLRRYLDGEDLAGDLDLIDLGDLEPCPECGARSPAGHGMRCITGVRERYGAS
jgi:hypothetical protein